MSNEYKNNHYVPVWYQKGFLPVGQENQELYYLDLYPEKFVDKRGQIHSRNAVRRLGFKHCFAEEDLYTTNFGTVPSRDIEKLFFGEIDTKGAAAIKYWESFTHPSINEDAFNDMVLYMSTQKLRTPKGLGWLADKTNTTNQTMLLNHMVSLRQLYCSIWTECIWLIADASQSDTKFIVSDHPVTVYNRVCGPRSQFCRGFNDPDISLNGTHTIFPLSLDKILILTNLSWVRNPYQSELTVRPNPNPWRTAMFKFLDIQTSRYLTEQEVIDINYIIKRRALRYVAGAKEEWLYPENNISTKKWNEYGHGYMLMPDPRGVSFAGQLLIGYENGTSTGFDEYGRRPWELEFDEESFRNAEAHTFYRFKGEFARLYGRERKGRSFNGASLDPEYDSEDLHEYYLSLDKKKKRNNRSN